MNPRVSEMQAADAADVHAVFAACFDTPWPEGDLAAETERRGALCLLARLDGAVVGYALFRAVLDESELLSIGVLPAWRGHGVGRGLLAEGLRRSLQGGVRRVHLEVRADNTPARILYERAGFVEVGRRAGYYADGTDARLMSWEAT